MGRIVSLTVRLNEREAACGYQHGSCRQLVTPVCRLTKRRAHHRSASGPPHFTCALLQATQLTSSVLARFCTNLSPVALLLLLLSGAISLLSLANNTARPQLTAPVDIRAQSRQHGAPCSCQEPLPSAARARPAHGPDEPCVGVATKSWSMTSSCSCLRSARINRPRAVERRRRRNVLSTKNQKHCYDLPLRNHLGLHPAGLHRRLAGHLEAMVNA